MYTAHARVNISAVNISVMCSLRDDEKKILTNKN